MSESLLISTTIVALAEIGDKTQLLSFILAARFRKAWPIIWGILVATLLNHGMAAAVGAWLTRLFAPETLRWTLAISFIAMALWILVPDKVDEDSAHVHQDPRWGVFGTTLAVFFLAEMGDKTQIATIGLAARFGDFWSVLAGTTAGMMLANIPAVLVGHQLAEKMPLRPIRMAAAGIFLAVGVVTLTGWFV
jgi:Ca2+/H+ antiporter, TMEM165/GDT1 family